MRILSVLLYICGVLSHPLPPPGPLEDIKAEAITNSEIAELLQQVNPKDYLETYGYLKGDATSQTQEDAIKLYQKKSHIEETGKINIDTLKQMVKPRCHVEDVLPGNNIFYSRFFTHNGSENGSLDPDKADPFKTSARSWSTKSLRWRIEGYSKDLSQGQQRSAFAKAFSKWAQVSGLSFTEVSSRSRAQLKIDFARRKHRGDSAAFDGKGGTLAHAFFPEDGRIHFDEDEHWSLDKNKKGSVNLQWVAIHEFGHALGLAHSDKRDAVMYPFYPGFVGDIRLRSDDINGIQSLYGASRLTAAGTEKGKHTSFLIFARNFESLVLFPNGISLQECTAHVEVAFQDTDGNPVLISGSKVYKFSDEGLTTQTPTSLEDEYPNWPEQIDAAFYSKSGKHYIFSKYYIAIYSPDFETPETMYNYKVGLPSDVDAAFQYSKNDKIYVFKKDLYWRVTEAEMTVDEGYPKLIGDGFAGVDSNINAAFTYKDNAYLFSNDQYYKFNPLTNEVDPGYPSDTANDWFNCNKADTQIAPDP